MAESHVGCPVDGVGKKLRTRHGVIGADDVHDEVVTIADPTTMTQMMGVHADGSIDVNSLFRDTLVNGIIDAINEYVEIDCTGLGSLGIQIVDSGGAWTGVLGFYGTVNGTDWDFVRTVQFGDLLTNGTTVNGMFFGQAGGLLKFRVYAIAWTGGACSVYIEGTAATNAVTLANSLPIGTNSIGIVSTKTLLIASAPTAASVGIASAQALAANVNRKGLVLINTHSQQTISIAFGAAAVLYSGITLMPNGGTFWMDEYMFSTAAVNAIASGAATNLAIQEYT